MGSHTTIDELRAKFGDAFVTLESRAQREDDARTRALARIGGAREDSAARASDSAPPQLMMEIIDAASGNPPAEPRNAEETISQLDVVAELDARIAHARKKLCSAQCAIRALLMSLAQSGQLRMVRASVKQRRAKSKEGGCAICTLHTYIGKIAKLRAQADALVACMPVANGFTMTSPSVAPFVAPDTKDSAQPEVPVIDIVRMIGIVSEVKAAEQALVALIDEIKKVEFIADFVIAQCKALSAKCQL